MDALQKSEVVISKVLTMLMEWGITECTLEFRELGLSSEYENHFYPCVRWLESEGVIRVGNYHRTMDSTASGIIANPVLTSYGFRILGQSISLGEEREKLSDAIRNVNSGSGTYAKIGNFTGGLLASFIKSLG